MQRIREDNFEKLRDLQIHLCIRYHHKMIFHDIECITNEVIFKFQWKIDIERVGDYRRDDPKLANVLARLLFFEAQIIYLQGGSAVFDYLQCGFYRDNCILRC